MHCLILLDENIEVLKKGAKLWDASSVLIPSPVKLI
jgi:hypothetical protein